MILGEVPRLARDPRNCEERKRVLLRRLLPLADDAPCGALNEAYNAGVKAISDAAMRRAAAAGGGVYFDAAAHLPSGVRDGVYLYSDDNHLTLDGAHQLAAHMRF